jgi:hypothetical protein
MLLDRNVVHNRNGWKEIPCTRNRKLATIICSWNIWRLWTTISAVEREQGLSLVDDWRHCCHCSWLKRRGATSMERGQVVFPARDCADVPFPFLKLNTYSNRFMSRATSPLLHCSQLPFDNKPLSNPCLHSPSPSVQQTSGRGNLCFNRVYA